MRCHLVLLAGWTALGACAAHDRGEDDPTARVDEARAREAAGTPPSPVEQAPVLGKLESQGHTVTIHASGPDGRGPTFSVRTRDGKMVTNGLTGDQLAARFPALFQDWKRAVARGAVPGEVPTSGLLDASL